MIVEKALVDNLKAFGLNSYEAKLWTALLSRGVASAGELSDISNVPRSRSYDVLEGLEAKGFIALKTAKPIVYVAIPPSHVLERIKASITTTAEKDVGTLDKLKTDQTLKELQILHAHGIEDIDPTEFSGNIRGRDNIYHHLAMMIKKASHDLVIASTKKGIERKKETFGDLLKEAKKRGVNIRFRVPKGTEINVVRELEQLGDVQFATQGCRACITDHKELLFMLHDDTEVHKNYDSAIWIHNPYVSSCLAKLMNS